MAPTAHGTCLVNPSVPYHTLRRLNVSLKRRLKMVQEGSAYQLVQLWLVREFADTRWIPAVQLLRIPYPPESAGRPHG